MAVLRCQGLGGYVVVAFPGLGLVGTIAGRYMVEKLSLKPTGYIYDKRVVPIMRVREGRLLYPVNIYSGQNFHVVLSEVILPTDITWDIMASLVGRAKRDGAQALIIISGVLMEGEGLYYIAGDRRASKIGEELGATKIENGVVAGASAAALALAREMGVPALLLLGPASHPQDYGAAEAVLRGLQGLLGVSIPLEDLKERGEKYRSDVVDPKMYG